MRARNHSSRFIEMFGTLDTPKVPIKRMIEVSKASGQYGMNASAIDYIEGRPRYIRITDICDDGSLNNDVKCSDIDDSAYSVNHGDVLFARTGATVGKTYLHKSGDACFAGYLIRYSYTEAVDPEYVLAYTHSVTYYDWVQKSQKVGAQPNISASQYDNMPLLIPSRMEQEEFLCLYRQADKSKFNGFKSRFIEMFGNPTSYEQNYPLKKLGECVEINPRRDSISLADSDLVSFVPMPSVNEEGYLQDVADVEYGSVKKGFTFFKNGDVLFAKITPCMENGKGAIAENLTNSIGMGSTEFYVLRPITNVSLGSWILALTRLPVFREKAAKNMTGTGGQKRVPSSFLSEFRVGLPPISAQNEFAIVYKQADKSKYLS